MRLVKGSDLSPAMQRQALAVFIHRFTGDHKPQWTRKPRPCGNEYPLQFASDADWLANTTFHVTEAGKIAQRPNHCESRPTWPNNPELRKETA